MNTILLLVIIIAVSIAILHALQRFVWAPKLRREAEAAPRITQDEAQSFWQEIEKATLPILKANVQNRRPQSPQESRIGGAPLAIGQDRTWPRGAFDGFPMTFVAQINFAECTQMEDFPTVGILQIFSSFDSLDETGGCEMEIRWEPTPTTNDLLQIPDELRKSNKQTSDFSEKARCNGLPLQFELGKAAGNPLSWPHEQNSLIYENRLPENDTVSKILDDWEAKADRIVEGYGTHWVGGHPRFVQVDVREDNSEHQHLDRVLFHLGFDKEINLGDAGEANVMISQKALLQKDFQKAYLTWDCS
jgi:uncharacterized protein YwqG